MCCACRVAGREQHGTGRGRKYPRGSAPPPTMPPDSLQSTVYTLHTARSPRARDDSALRAGPVPWSRGERGGRSARWGAVRGPRCVLPLACPVPGAHSTHVSDLSSTSPVHSVLANCVCAACKLRKYRVLCRCAPFRSVRSICRCAHPSRNAYCAWRLPCCPLCSFRPCCCSFARQSSASLPLLSTTRCVPLRFFACG